jgi:hypothetical protein
MAFIRTIRQGKRTYRAIVRNIWDKTAKKHRQQVVKWLGRTGETVPAEDLPITMSCRSTEEKYLFSVLTRRRSLLVHGAWGVGKTFLAQRVCLLLKEGRYSAHFFRWATPQGQFIKDICEALGIPTEKDNGDGEMVRIPQAQLLQDIGLTLVEEQHILILDKAHSIPAQIRNHIEVWLEQGAVLLLVGTLPAKKELYLKFPRWELKPLDRTQSLKLVQAAARHYGVKLPYQQARELATKGNGNPQFLIRSVLDMDIQAEDDPDQAEWIDLSPLVMVGLCLLIALRFIGQGLSDRNLVIMGGMGAIAARVGYLVMARTNKKHSKIGQ